MSSRHQPIQKGYNVEPFWETFKDGLDRARLYFGAVLIVVGVHEFAGNGPDLVVAGVLLFVVSRSPVAINVIHYDGDTDDGDVVEDDDGKHVIEAQPKLSPRDLTLI
jgi:hypothetical protein